ncbi:MAG: hypothetical protein ACI35M_06000 [Alistipes sp.]
MATAVHDSNAACPTQAASACDASGVRTRRFAAKALCDKSQHTAAVDIIW